MCITTIKDNYKKTRDHNFIHNNMGVIEGAKEEENEKMELYFTFKK